MDLRNLNADRLRTNAQPVHFSDVLNSGDIVANDDHTSLAVTWKRGTPTFNVWAYGSGQFVKAGNFATEQKPDRTRTAVAVARRHLKAVRKDLGL